MFINIFYLRSNLVALETISSNLNVENSYYVREVLVFEISNGAFEKRLRILTAASFLDESIFGRPLCLFFPFDSP